jgi:hypothetical protein
MSKEKAASLVVRVTGTSPLSFDLWPGVTLTVKEISPSAQNRPTLGGKFTTKGYLLFNGITKVGRLSPASLKKIGDNVPLQCKVVEVDKGRKILSVEFRTGQ